MVQGLVSVPNTLPQPCEAYIRIYRIIHTLHNKLDSRLDLLAGHFNEIIIIIKQLKMRHNLCQ